MVQEISIDEYFDAEIKMPLIDVRSPGEFLKGHIPGAANIALFSNSERAEVGTAYKQQSREIAMELGYKFVTPKLEFFIEESRKVAKQGPVAVHCWRGGMRSNAFANYLSENGFNEVYLIKGGYKAFRNYVLRYFEQPFNLRVIGGFTGSGKTYILKELFRRGEQVIDLEGIANHKGSAFGAIGEKEQPTVEHFENCLHQAFNQLNLKEPVWIEDESITIGKVKLPMALFKQIRAQRVCFIDVPREERAKLLVKDYAQYGNELLSEAIQKIKKRLGGQSVKDALSFLQENNYYEVAMIALHYYDKTYTTGVKARDPQKVYALALANTNPSKNADLITNLFQKYEQN